MANKLKLPDDPAPTAPAEAAPETVTTIPPIAASEAAPSEGVESPPPAIEPQTSAEIVETTDFLDPPGTQTFAVVDPPAPTAPGPIPGLTDGQIEIGAVLTDEQLEELTRPDSPGGVMITTDEVKGFLLAVAAGEAHVLPELVAELADAIAGGRAPGVTQEQFQQVKALLPVEVPLPPVPRIDWSHGEPPKLVRVEFLESMIPYAAGNLAGFPKEYADRLIAKGIAKLSE